MVEKEHLAYLIYIRNSSAKVPPIDSVAMVREFLKVFSTDLSAMPSDRNIH